MLEALFHSGVPWEDLYANDIVIIAESLKECVRRLLIWKEAMEEKGLRVNAGKMKIIICRVQASFHVQMTLITDVHGARELQRCSQGSL